MEMSDFDKFAADYERMMRRAERNARLFHGVAWDAHLETLRDDELPGLIEKQALIQANMKTFAGEDDELERLDELHEFVAREIAHLKNKQIKRKGKRK